MTKSIHRAFMHFVWATKGRAPLISDSHDPDIERIIAAQCARLQWLPIAVGCTCDHVHVLCRIGLRTPLLDLVRSIKSASAVLVNREHPTTKLQWQEGYAAITVEPARIEAVGLYVHEQRLRHRRRELDAELEHLPIE